MKKIAQPIKLVLLVALSGISFFSLITLVAAQSPLVHRLRGVRLILPPLPPGPPPGGRIRGGAKRGSCPTMETDLTALVPFTRSNLAVMNVWGLTTMERPTLWVYVPYPKSFAYPAEFVLLDDQLNPVYHKSITLPDMPGVIGVPIGAMAPPLAVGKRYRWFFNVYCNQQPTNTLIYVEGVMQRVTLNQATLQQLQIATPEQQVSIYASNGIWHDALTRLAQLRQQSPQDEKLETEWKSLLEAIGLNDVAQKPLVAGDRFNRLP